MWGIEASIDSLVDPADGPQRGIDNKPCTILGVRDGVRRARSESRIRPSATRRVGVPALPQVSRDRAKRRTW